MSFFSHPRVAAFLARRLQGVMPKMMAKQSGGVDPRDRLPEFQAELTVLTIPASPPAPAVVYRASASGVRPGVHVNFHGGGYILGQHHEDDALCRAVAQHAGVAVIDVDYAVAPQHPFPIPTSQAAEVVRWVVDNAAEQGWDATRLTIGGQSAGGTIATAVCRQMLREGGPTIRLQVLQYPPLDMTVPAGTKHSPLAKPLLRPWMGDIFDASYVPDRSQRSDPLVSPAAATDAHDLTGIAPAVVIAARDDILYDEDVRYAERLDRAGALVELIEIPDADHSYDVSDDARAKETYLRIAHHIRAAVA